MADTTEHFEKIRLDPSLTKAWYGHTLVGGTISTTPEKPVDPEPLSSRKEVLVFIKPLDPSGRTTGMQFLSDILKACRLTLDGIALFEGPGPGDLDTLRRECTPRVMILFGISPAQTGLPLHFPPFQVQEYYGIKLVSAPEIDALRDDKAMKGKLWSSLKQIFSL